MNPIQVLWKDKDGVPREMAVDPSNLAEAVAELDENGATHVVIEAGHLLKPRIELNFKPVTLKALVPAVRPLILCRLLFDGQVGNLTMDRREGYGIELYDTPYDRDVALAYKRAVADGVFFKRRWLTRDINGRWFVMLGSVVLPKYMASDLRQRGYLK